MYLPAVCSAAWNYSNVVDSWIAAMGPSLVRITACPPPRLPVRAGGGQLAYMDFVGKSGALIAPDEVRWRITHQRKKKYVLNKDESGVDADETMRGAAETFLDSDDTCYTTKEKKNKKKI